MADVKERISAVFAVEFRGYHSYLIESNVFMRQCCNRYIMCFSSSRAPNYAGALRVVEDAAYLSEFCKVKGLDEVLEKLGQMDLQGFAVSKDVLYFLLQECTRKKDLTATRQVQSLIVSNGLESMPFLGDHLIRLFTFFGSLHEANQVFCKVSNPSVYTWHAIISAHVKLRECAKALKLYHEMQQAGIKPDKVTFLSVLKACALIHGVAQGRLIHDEIIRSGIELNTVVGNSLVDMYAKCGCLEDLQKVFDNLPSPSVVSWGAMIAGYIENGHGFTACELFEKMQEEGIKPNKVIGFYILKACGSIGAVGHGRQVHNWIIRNALELDMIIGSTLIGMYAKCGSLEEARFVFDNLQNQDVISWGAMLAGYAQHGESLLAFGIFNEMQYKSVKPDKVIFLCLLKACQSTGTIKQGSLIHEEIVRVGFEKDVVIGNALLDMHAKCGSLDGARNMFDRLSNQDVVSWGAIIAGYVHHSDGLYALEVFSQMQQLGVKPDKVTFLFVLKACAIVGEIIQGRVIHNLVINSGLEQDVDVGSALVDMYSKCESVEEARKLFDELPERTVVSWGAMIAGYAEHGHDLPALELRKKMQLEGVEPDEITVMCLLRACGRMEAIDDGRLIHVQIRNVGAALYEVVGSTLIDMYFMCGCVEEAQKAFDDLPSRNVVCWLTMIAGYVQCGHDLAALDLFVQMHQKGIEADKTSKLIVLKVCSSIGIIGKGRLIHDSIVKSELEADAVVASALINMYAKCRSLEDAHNVFNKLANPDGVSWSALITGYAQHGYGLIALELFEKMEGEGLTPDEVSFLCVLKACGSIGAICQGRVIHEQIVSSGFESDAIVGNALVDMYAKCGCPKEAYTVFYKLQNPNWVPYGAMISGYAQHGNNLPALALFGTMQDEVIVPGNSPFLCILKACSNIGGIGQGRLIHDQIIRIGVECNAAIGNTLVDMYAKCGSQKEACKVFDKLSHRDVVSWSAIIAGCANNGNCKLALLYLEDMLNCGLKPDAAVYTSILAACSQSGLLEEGCQSFKSMVEVHDAEPRIDHYNCMIDLFGRAGHLNEAADFLRSMPVSPGLVGWLSLLTGCNTYGNVELGRECFDQTVDLDPSDASGYMLMSKLYTDSHQFQKRFNIQELRKCTGAIKKPGISWIEINDFMHEIIVGNRRHIQGGEAYTKLIRISSLVKGEGHVPFLDSVLELMLDNDARLCPVDTLICWQ